jgi:hypothetical protein
MLIVSISREKIEDELIGKNPFAIVLLCVDDSGFLFNITIDLFCTSVSICINTRVEGIKAFNTVFFTICADHYL